MTNEPNPQTEPTQPFIYQIRVQGHLGTQWTDWFGGLTITEDGNGDTLLTGPVVDQPALYGLLRQVRDLGLTLISLNRVETVHAPVPEFESLSGPKEIKNEHS